MIKKTLLAFTKCIELKSYVGIIHCQGLEINTCKIPL